MAITYKERNTYANKTAVSGDEKIPVSSTEFITPSQIAGLARKPVATSIPPGGMLPNTLYRLGTLPQSITFTLADPPPQSETTVQHYYFTFTTPESAPTVTWPVQITSWSGGEAPTIEGGRYYEVSVLDGVGAILEG